MPTNGPRSLFPIVTGSPDRLSFKRSPGDYATGVTIDGKPVLQEAFQSIVDALNAQKEKEALAEYQAKIATFGTDPVTGLLPRGTAYVKDTPEGSVPSFRGTPYSAEEIDALLGNRGEVDPTAALPTATKVPNFTSHGPLESTTGLGLEVVRAPEQTPQSPAAQEQVPPTSPYGNVTQGDIEAYRQLLGISNGLDPRQAMGEVTGSVYGEGGEFNRSLQELSDSVSGKAEQDEAALRRAYRWEHIRDILRGVPAVTYEEWKSARAANVAQNEAIARGAPLSVEGKRQQVFGDYLQNAQGQQQVPYAGGLAQAALQLRQADVANIPNEQKMAVLNYAMKQADLKLRQTDVAYADVVRAAELEYQKARMATTEAERQSYLARAKYYEQQAQAAQAKSLLDQLMAEDLRNANQQGSGNFTQEDLGTLQDVK